MALAILAGFVSRSSFAAEESCNTCDKKISFTGDFVHRRSPGRTVVEGAAPGTEDVYREAIYGSNIVATVSGLPSGKYEIIIGVAELDNGITNAGQRVFAVTSGDTVIANDFDIVAAAGGAGKVTFIKGTVDHQIDSVGGPIVVAFRASVGQAKINSFEVRDPATATSVLTVRASDLTDPADALARAIPSVSGPVLWTDPAQPRAARVKDLVSRMSLAEKARQMGNGAPAIHRDGLDLPAYNYWSEALHGVARAGTATVFPQAIGNGATWDNTLVKQMSHVIGIEGRAINNRLRAQTGGNSSQFYGLNYWSPNINIFRDPRWGRGQETYGEDTFLTSRMGVAFIQGLQGDDPKYTLALACAKHYAVHSGPEALRHRFDADPSERDFYETYLPHFEAAVREGHVGAIMSAYNAVYGEPAPSSTLLLTDILRKRWGFDGQVVSDCDAVGDIWQAMSHHVVATPEAAAARAIKGGTDLCCGRTYNSLLGSVSQNLITVPEIDVALGRILESRFKLGLFDPTNMVPYLSIGTDQLDTAANRKVALQLARESMVLLKNEGVLPLDRAKLKHIAVIGPNADSVNMQWGNYNGQNRNTVTILNGIKAVAGTNIEVTTAVGCPIAKTVATAGGRGGRGGFGGQAAAPTTPELIAQELNDALTIASNADVIIYVGGINSTLEGEEGTRSASEGFSNGDRTQIELPQVQEDLLRALYATGKPVIFVNCSGCAMAMPWAAEHLPAIVQAWYPGEEGGTAVGEVLFGNYNPAGRLPVTFYRSTADLPAFTNYSMDNRTYRYFAGLPLYAFGHGLSYTHFDYSRISLASKKVKAGDTITVSFTVANRGIRDGDEVAQVYFRHLDSAVPQPREALVAFGRVHVPTGQTAKLSLDIPVERLRYWDTTKEDYTVETGNYELMIGAASDDIRQRVALSVVK